MSGPAAVTVLSTAWDVIRVNHAGPSAVAARQERRLNDLVAFARVRSPYYRRLYAGLPARVEARRLPPVAKPELMAHFDEWVTHPEVTLDGVRTFVADSSRVGQRYLGRYWVFTTSGTTGEPAILVQDRDAWLVSNVLVRLRARPGMLGRPELVALLRRGFRQAALFATGGHFGAVVLSEYARRRSSWIARNLRVFSVLRPVRELVEELNAFQPTILNGYPSALAVLAEQQAAGRLRIRPVLALSVGETLTPATRTAVEAAFGCRIAQAYGSSECPALGMECRDRRVHLNVDRFLVEPVDADHRPVPAGTPSDTVLVTNLVNRIQPVIRYDLGDRLTIDPDPCTCGSPLPAVHVEGRTDDVLTFDGPDGERVRVLPLAVGSVVEETPGVQRFQLVQTAPARLTLRLDVAPDADRERVWSDAESRLADFLRTQGAGVVGIDRDPRAPSPDPRSGKLRQVSSAL